MKDVKSYVEVAMIGTINVFVLWEEMKGFK